MEEIGRVLVALLIVTPVALIFWMGMRWCVEDARLRGRSPLFVCCAVLLFFPWGWIAWLVFRPDEVERVGPLNHCSPKRWM